MKTANWLQAWDRWWLGDIPPHALAIARIAAGCFLFVYAATYMPHVSLLFSDQGIALPLYVESAPSWLQWICMAPPPPVAWLLFGLLLLSIAGFTLGIAFRTATLTLLLLALYFWQIQLHLFPTSYNRLLFVTLIVLLFSGADRTLSLRMRLERGSWLASRSICALPQRLLMIQITATYVGVGLQKFALPGWQGGEVLLHSFQGMWATPLAFMVARMQLPLWLYNMSPPWIALLEVAVPLGLFLPKWRFWAAGLGTAFHLFIALFLGIWWFLFLPPFYVLFWPPKQVANAVRR